ncbi:sialidase family protein [Primorskyibacter sedentarius]|uniref:sialidase family protein n=1 Tax=Primorskyibacter sedentarius TaxID=745311 RepID=UPI003EB81E01
MPSFPKDPPAIALAMTGRVESGTAILPSPCIQNHAAFLARSPNGELECVWFGGSLEGKADICIYRSRLLGAGWTAPEKLTDDPERSEQNPVLFHAPDGRCLLLHTAQPGGDQDKCVIRMREIGHPPQDLSLPGGSFVRARPILRSDGAWLLPLFHCTPQAGARWTGRHDTASVAISADAGISWRQVAVPGSTGCVHMTIVPGDDRLVAFFRRRQADFVHRSESRDGGETWSVPVATPVPNNNSSLAATRLADGRLALCCNPVNAAMFTDRRASLYDELGDDARPEASGGCTPIWGVPRAPLVVLLSEDDGQTFPRSLTVADSTGTCLSNNSEDGRNQELSYPAMLEAPDGGLDIAFTLHRRAIAYRHLTPNEIANAT